VASKVVTRSREALIRKLISDKNIDKKIEKVTKIGKSQSSNNNGDYDSVLVFAFCASCFSAHHGIASLPVFAF
jgi:hypothetical protein